MEDPPASAASPEPRPGGAPAPASSRRGVDCPPESRPLPAGRKGVVPPPRRSTREFSGAQSGRGRRTATTQMPSCVGDGSPASAVIQEGRAAAVVPRRLPPREKIELAPLDPRDVFVLSMIDGHSSVEALLDIASVGPPELASILDRLVSLGLITLE